MARHRERETHTTVVSSTNLLDMQGYGIRRMHGHSSSIYSGSYVCNTLVGEIKRYKAQIPSKTLRITALEQERRTRRTYSGHYGACYGRLENVCLVRHDFHGFTHRKRRNCVGTVVDAAQKTATRCQQRVRTIVDPKLAWCESVPNDIQSKLPLNLHRSAVSCVFGV